MAYHKSDRTAQNTELWIVQINRAEISYSNFYTLILILTWGISLQSEQNRPTRPL